MRRLIWFFLATGLACSEPESRRLPNEEERAVADSLPPAQAPAPPEPNAARPVVLIVGTSLTAGLGLDPENAYPAILQHMADSAGYRVSIVPAGVSGETSAGALRRIDWLLQRPADVIVVETGANDGLRGLDVDSTRANLREILRRSMAAKPAAQLFLVQMQAPPNLGPQYTSAFRAMFPAVAQEAGANVIPFLLDGVAGLPEMNQSDGIHPNIRGSRRVAENVWGVLQPALRSYARAR